MRRINRRNRLSPANQHLCVHLSFCCLVHALRLAHTPFQQTHTRILRCDFFLFPSCSSKVWGETKLEGFASTTISTCTHTLKYLRESEFDDHHDVGGVRPKRQKSGKVCSTSFLSSGVFLNLFFTIYHCRLTLPWLTSQHQNILFLVFVSILVCVMNSHGQLRS